MRSANDVINHVKWQTIRVEKRSVKRYYNTSYKLSLLNKAERLLVDFITEEMDDNNIISNTISFRRDFTTFLIYLNQETYSDNYISRSFRSLCKNSVLFELEGRGVYRVSPFLFFKGTEAKRVKLIKELMSRQSGLYDEDLKKDITLYKKSP
ncbi:MAG: hypothetical protein ACWA5P_01865 [bacterium]